MPGRRTFRTAWTARARALAVLALFSIGVASGCGRVPVAGGPPAPPGRADGAPARIVSLSPNVTEVLHGVGAFDRVVAVSTYCDYPPETARLPRVGTWQSTNLEQIQSLAPDLIVMTDAQGAFVKDQLEALGIRTLVVRAQSLEDVLSSILEIGRATGNAREAEALAAQTREALDEVRARTRDLPRPRVLCVVDRVPGTLRDLYAATRGSFLDELIGVAGGESVATPSESGYGEITKEAVASIDPDVIIDMVQGQTGAYTEDPRTVWRELPEIKAVAAGRVYPMRDTSVLHPSQFVADTARLFARTIHPEAFGHDEPSTP
jgi:iron complex transport system substrate-binding protein